MSKDALKKFRPSSGMPNIKQKFKRMGYMADGGGVTAGQQMDVSNAVNTMSMQPTNTSPLPPMQGLKKGGAVRGCGMATKGKTKGRMV
tara:strand:+ start:1000 stop:1263 length:264 start_codon:yes stop_codon:yes gene_type:complete